MKREDEEKQNSMRAVKTIEKKIYISCFNFCFEIKTKPTYIKKKKIKIKPETFGKIKAVAKLLQASHGVNPTKCIQCTVEATSSQSRRAPASHAMLCLCLIWVTWHYSRVR